ncbi:MAG TPA: 5-oxoprolinase subunit PxpB [Candidatus Saccharimonadia bacterium]|nr:5-oxoprolinase subunit PxpB [Candidatus Saccharimonadia bacterium]
MAASDDDGFGLEEIADCAWLVRFDGGLSRETNERVHAAARAMRAARLPGVVDIVPAYASIAVVFDEPSVDSRDALAERVYELALESGPGRSLPRRTVVVPAAYGGSEGPDLEELARRVGLSPDEVVRRHSAVGYTVGMLGFLPGFPYLIGLDPALHLARRDTPRAHVPAGSIGIGAAQTGIYPITSPGGWHLIGRTAAVLFDASRNPPTLLEPGDNLRFRAVDANVLASSAVEVTGGEVVGRDA